MRRSPGTNLLSERWRRAGPRRPRRLPMSLRYATLPLRELSTEGWSSHGETLQARRQADQQTGRLLRLLLSWKASHKVRLLAQRILRLARPSKESLRSASSPSLTVKQLLFGSPWRLAPRLLPTSDHFLLIPFGPSHVGKSVRRELLTRLSCYAYTCEHCQILQRRQGS